MTISLASSESNCPPITDPLSTPASTRTPGPAGKVIAETVPGAGQEPSAGVLTVDPELDRVPAWLRVVEQVQHLALGDAELLAHEVEPGGLLRDRVLDLQPGVDLEERDQPVLPDEELDGAGPVVAGLAADRLRGLVDRGALLVGQERRGRLLDELLEAALQRAVAGADDDHVAVRVGQHLRLDVARLVQVALHEALAAAERGRRLADRRLVQLGDLPALAGDLHPPATAAERRLDRDRQAVLVGELLDLGGTRDGVRRARHQRGTGAHGDVPCGDLVAEVPDGLRGGADPDQPGVDDRLCEVGVLARGTRSPGGSRRRRRAGRCRRPCRCRGTTPPPWCRRARTPRPRAGRKVRRGRGRRRSRRWRGRRHGRRARPGQRSPRGSRRGPWSIAARTASSWARPAPVLRRVGLSGV